MINLEKYERLLNLGLTLDHYFLLSTIATGGETLNNKRIQGFVNLLTKRGYIEDGVLTDKAVLLVDVSFDSDTTTTTTTRAPEEVVEKNVDFTGWVISLHQRLQKRLKELTGGKQVRDKINGKPYSFLPNATDMGKNLRKIIVLYKLKDIDAIERMLFAHINECHKAKSWFPLINSYIFKNNASSLVTDLENPEKTEGANNIEDYATEG